MPIVLIGEDIEFFSWLDVFPPKLLLRSGMGFLGQVLEQVQD